MAPLDLYLASASPRRAELLTQLGLRYAVVTQQADESVQLGEHPADYAERLARDKAESGLALLASNQGIPVLGSDTCVVVDDTILGKPGNREQGLAMLSLLSGRSHEVMSAVALADGKQTLSRLSVSRVRFASLTEQQIAAYWETGEPADKAGAYAIQGRAAQFIEHLEGSFSGVMGLPLFETAELLNAFNIKTL